MCSRAMQACYATRWLCALARRVQPPASLAALPPRAPLSSPHRAAASSHLARTTNRERSLTTTGSAAAFFRVRSSIGCSVMRSRRWSCSSADSLASARASSSSDTSRLTNLRKMSRAAHAAGGACAGAREAGGAHSTLSNMLPLCNFLSRAASRMSTRRSARPGDGLGGRGRGSVRAPRPLDFVLHVVAVRPVGRLNDVPWKAVGETRVPRAHAPLGRLGAFLAEVVRLAAARVRITGPAYARRRGGV